MVTLQVNGEERRFDGDPSMPLLWYLRDELGLTGTKFGCGIAECGACTVHVDGEAARSCGTAMSDVAGRKVTTIEALDPEGNHPVQKGMARRQRAAMRLLSGRPDHAGRSAALGQQESDRATDQRSHVGQYLSLRLLSTHHRRGQSGSHGGLT